MSKQRKSPAKPKAKQRRLRKPKEIQIGNYFKLIVDTAAFPDEMIFIGSYWLSVKQTKEIHAWLGKAIAYLEQERK